MLPVFRPGGVALAEGTGPGLLRPGDCAVYLYGGRTLLHRVLAAGPEGAWLADDAGRLTPHLVPWSAVLGRALGGPLAGGLCGLVYSRLRRAVYALFHFNA